MSSTATHRIHEVEGLAAAETLISSVYTNVRLSSRGEQHGLRIERIPVGRLRVDRIDLRLDYEAIAEPLTEWFLGRVRRGHMTYRSSGSETVSFGPGALYMPIEPGRSFTAQIERAQADVVLVPPGSFDDLAETAPGRRDETVRLLDNRPLPGAGVAWSRTVDHVLACADDPNVATNPLLVDQLEQLLLAVTLETFPNNALTDPTRADRRDAHPSTVRRAISYIEANPQRAVTLQEMALAASVTTRALQFAFRRHLDTTPTAYLRRIRLDAAHRDLQKADPARETVAEIAARWGFTNPGRFSAAYRAAYGTAPTNTLRS